MNKSFYLGCACVGCAVAATVSTMAAESGPYLKAEIGPTLVEDVNVRELFDVPGGSRIDFDPGFRFAIGGGYSFSDFIAIGGETGMSYNTIQDISGGNVSEGDSGIGNVPLLGNIVFKLPNKFGVVPFAGAGAGVSFNFFEADGLIVPDATSPTGRSEIEGTESDAVFAWQLFGGVKFALNEQMSLGISYKYLHTEAPEWDATDFDGFERDIRLGSMETHAVTLIFSFKF